MNIILRIVVVLFIACATVFHPAAASAPKVPDLHTWPLGVAPCSGGLQACIDGVEAGDTIQINRPILYPLMTYHSVNEILINKSITLQGNFSDASEIEIRPTGSHRVFKIDSQTEGTVTLRNLTIYGGYAPLPGPGGGAILNFSDYPLVLDNVIVTHNTSAVSGGGIYASGPLVLTDSRVNNNTSVFSGGGIYAGGDLNMTRTVVANNSSTASYGGGLSAYQYGADWIITDSTFSGNSAVGFGGGISSGANGDLVLTNVLIEGNTVTASSGGIGNGGGVQVDASGSLVMTGGTVRGNTASGKGGGIYGDTLNLNGVVVENNQAVDGGGVYAFEMMSITDCDIHGNTASGKGGGVNFSSVTGNLTLTGSGAGKWTQIASNTAAADGGGIYTTGQVNLVGEVRLLGNIATTGAGGGIAAAALVDSPSPLPGLLARFESNTSGSHGGAVAALGGAWFAAGVALDDSLPEFINNTAGGGTGADGGAIYSAGSLSLAGSSSESNRARKGGALYAVGQVNLNGDTFAHNQAVNQGGALFAGGQTSLTGNGFEDNRVTAASACGGAVSAETGPVTAQGNTFLANSAPGTGGMGGAACLKDATIRQDTYRDNQADAYGGAIYALGTTSVDRSLFDNNRAKTAALVQYFSTPSGLTLTNSLFSRSVSVGGGVDEVAVFGGTATIHNNTFADPALQQTAIHAAGVMLSARNNIFSNYQYALSAINGSAVTRGTNLLENAALSIDGTCTDTDLGDNLTGDPLFVDRPGQDYHLTRPSPAFNTGANLGAQYDYDGDYRCVYGAVDIGFDELGGALFLPAVSK